MPRTNESSVFLGKTSMDGISKEDMCRLTFSTTTSFNYSGRQQSVLEKPENMNEVFGIGQRSTKYCGYQLKVAPGMGRSSHSYSVDFAKKAVGDCFGNNAAAKHYKDRGASGGKASFGEMMSNTAYREDFCRLLSPDKMRASKPDPVIPSASSAGDSSGQRSYYTSSWAHDTFRVHPSVGRSFSAAELLPKNSLEIPKTAPAGPMKSSYGADFVQPAVRRRIAADRRRRGPP
eukprot:TRINITY_DN5692_c0_g2_i1.p1 TRINITY_DN5692_c0_g2~~TRINITY_DN5692_c0_g2_i1.p1  ORF type:complete len:232 (+),score=32.28 TRINITY_DN5692_c0_g2_i1:69-764(+)